jgi:NADH:ubiquinone oxidoreductase subunit D
MIINMGPQHPSTHGVLRLMLELDGEFVLRTKPVIGYLHTGMEKTGEELTYVQGATNVTRMDYLSPAHQRAGASPWPSRRCSTSRSRRARPGSAC